MVQPKRLVVNLLPSWFVPARQPVILQDYSGVKRSAKPSRYSSILVKMQFFAHDAWLGLLS